MSYKFYEESDFVLLYYPAFQGVIGFKILGIQNKNFENWAYGPVPLSFVDASNVTHEVGVIPNSFVTPHYELPNTLPGLATTTNYQTDLFYHPDAATLYDFCIDYSNVLIRNYLEVPYQAPAASGYGTTFTAPGITNESDFGYIAGEFRQIAQPNMFMGVISSNETNRNLRTNLQMRLRIYQVAVVASGPLLYDMITKQGDARNTYVFTIGGTRWVSDTSMFTCYGLDEPISVLDMLNAGRTGSQNIVSQNLTQVKGASYLNPSITPLSSSAVRTR